MLHSSQMVYMNHMELMIQDLLLSCTKKVPKIHYNFFHFRHGGETHFLVLAQTLIYCTVHPNCGLVPCLELLCCQNVPVLAAAIH